MKSKETRMLEFRADDSSENGEMILEGYAIVFEEETLIGDEQRGFIEIIDRNALEGTIMKDVPMKYNHSDSNLILARTKNGSLTLKVDDKGLFIRANLIDTSTNRDVYKMVKNGLLDKMSFAFTVGDEDVSRKGELPYRRITKIDRLFDVSVVDVPAYEQSSIYARSLELVETELNALEEVKLAEKRKVALAIRKAKIKLGIGG